MELPLVNELLEPILFFSISILLFLVLIHNEGTHACDKAPSCGDVILELDLKRIFQWKGYSFSLLSSVFVRKAKL